MAPMRELPPTAGMPIEPIELFNLVFSSGDFSDSIIDFLKVDNVEFFSSATTALWISFETVKRMTGRTHVILPGYSCPLVVIAAHAAGLKVRLCDLRPNSFDLDQEHLKAIIDENVAAIVPTDMAGLPCDIDGLAEIARVYDAYVIEDAAQAFGATRGAKHLGRDADITVFSFAAGKGMSLLDGGIATTTNRELRRILRSTSAELLKSNFGLAFLRSLQLLGYSFLYNPIGLKWIYGSDLRKSLSTGDLVQAVGDYFELEQPHYKFADWRLNLGTHLIKRLPQFVSENRRRALKRVQQIEKQTNLMVLQESPETQGNWPFLFLLCDSQKTRNKIMSDLWTAGLGVSRLFIHELAGYEYLAPLIESNAQSTPHAGSLAERSFTITNTEWLDDETFKRILEVLKSYAPVPV